MCGHENRFAASEVETVDGDGVEQFEQADCGGCGERFRFDGERYRPRPTVATWEKPLAAALLAAILVGFVAALILMKAV